MIVIEGKNRKSIVLENLIRKSFMTNNVLIIDTVGLKYLSEKSDFKHVILEEYTNHNELIKAFEKDYIEFFSEYDWIAFYVNSDVSSIEDFKVLDRKYVQNFIVTVQRNNGLTNTYYI